MQHRQVQGRSEAGPAARGPGRAGKPAETGGGSAGVESQLAELKTRVDGLEMASERAEVRWEKWRTDQVEMGKEMAEMKKEQAEMKKEQVAMRKETAAGFRRSDEKMELGFQQLVERMDAGFQRADEKMDAGFRRAGDRFEALLREIAATAQRADEKLQEVSDQLTKRFILRLEVAAGLILAAILGTGIFG